MSEFTHSYDVGQFRGIVILIGTRLSPNANNVESFASILFFELEDGTRVEVAKVDDSEHEEGKIHVDRYYRESGVDPHDFDVDINAWWEGEGYLEENWDKFVQKYLDTHGKQQRG